MKKRWRPSSSAVRSEEGFTFVEVLAALAILSIAGVGAVQGLSGALRAVNAAGERAAENAALLRLDDDLRSIAARVRTPYWEDGHALDAQPDGLHVSHLDADPGRAVVFSCAEGAVTIADGDRMRRYAGFREAAFSPALDGKGLVFGVKLEIVRRDSTRITITARFGGSPLPTGPGG